MTIENDETLQIYLEESREHLANIENDFLAIEKAGAEINEELVNKVYRAAHSIKGGAGFMGLTIIKDLTHEMENILGKIRSRDLIPNPEIVNILLMASDALKNLIEDVFNSNDADISDHIEALRAIADGSATDRPQTISGPVTSQDEDRTGQETNDCLESEVTQTISFSFPDGRYMFSASQKDIAMARDEGKRIYLIEMDLMFDVIFKGKKPREFAEEMQACGVILGSSINVDSICEINGDGDAGSIPFFACYASILKPNDINKLFEIDEGNIFEMAEDMSVNPIPRSTPDRSAASRPEDSKTGSEIKSQAQSKSYMRDHRSTEDTSQKESLNPAKARTEAAAGISQQKKKSPGKQDHVSGSETGKGKSKEQDTQTTAVGSDTSLRVHVSLLDSLMNLAGELVLSRNQLIQAFSSGDQRASELAGQRIDLITSELQEAIMLTRMQAVGNVFNKFPRVVRDLARKLGKDINLILEGNDVEMDKTIIEAISDPLTHLVRNSVDHGIETPEERQKSGKDQKGLVRLKAFHEAGQVNIEIFDDGRGLDGKKLASAAVAKGLITEEQTSTMSEKEKVNLIFLPGFSTAKEITDVSGRGVGMDVVKTNLDKLGGVIDIESKLGEGTAIRIKLPLTLAIIPCQIIATSGERYAIPQVNLEELLRIPASQVKERIERVGYAEVVRLRGNLLPLLKLADVIGIEKTFVNPETDSSEPDKRRAIADRRCKKSPLFRDKSAQEDERSHEKEAKHPRGLDRRYHAASALNIVVVSTGSMKYGLVVDDLHDSEEIVVKPLGRHLKHCKGYAGATIMGDGKVALILDVANLARMAQLTSLAGTDRAAEVSKEASDAAAARNDRQSLLIFRNSDDEQFVVPLNQVERIEKIMRSQMEDVGGRKVLQYRGGTLPLFSIDQVAHVKPIKESEELLVVVFSVTGRAVGLMAMGPVDVMEVSVEFDESTIKQDGILGSAIIAGHTTLLVDVYGIVKILNPEWFIFQDQEKVKNKDGEAPTVLVVEDSNFFRNQVKSYMEGDGYNVVEAEDGLDAWNKLEEHAEEISLVCTDIEMPNMDGFGLTAKIRSEARYSSLPIVALTTLAGDEDIARGKRVGVDEYHIKLDKERLMESVRRFLKKGRSI
ncbi:CheA2 [uncultured Desulfobacterium sp.]|uniref:Chemotaxis protein CheA n=1 Tax=uncultured Desulfobacterium sp. TaxID=201089 RepID=A0A445MTJ2_9BACT|nr:CheA2 [uncultured Desulfobacterium sp.]